MVQELLNIEQFCQKNSTKSKPIFLGKLGCVLAMSPWLMRFLEGDFVTLRPMVQDIMNFENHLEREISLVTSSHLDMPH
jgi:hypothetical protein